MTLGFLTPLRTKRWAAIIAGVLSLGAVAAKLTADEIIQQRDRTFVTNELSRVQAMVDRSGTSVALAAQEISALHDSFSSLRDRIAHAAAALDQRQAELVGMITAHERMAVQLEELRHKLTSDFADAESRLVASSERIGGSKMQARQRQKFTVQVEALRQNVGERRNEITAIEAAAGRNAAVLAVAQTTLADMAAQQEFADAAAVRAGELEERSEVRQSRARELSRQLQEAQREINTLTNGIAVP